jgi:PIN domain nuclease of toxin-antitoxin system
VKRYLLDTHCFLWSLFEPEKLGSQAVSILENLDNSIYISTVSFWEISLKYETGKLVLTCPPDKLIVMAEKMGLKTIPLSVEEAALFYKLPKSEHKDPFDRMLIWQAILHKFILISKDSKFENYRQFGLKTVW